MCCPPVRPSSPARRVFGDHRIPEETRRARTVRASRAQQRAAGPGRAGGSQPAEAGKRGGHALKGEPGDPPSPRALTSAHNAVLRKGEARARCFLLVLADGVSSSQTAEEGLAGVKRSRRDAPPRDTPEPAAHRGGPQKPAPCAPAAGEGKRASRCAPRGQRPAFHWRLPLGPELREPGFSRVLSQPAHVLLFPLVPRES